MYHIVRKLPVTWSWPEVFTGHPVASNTYNWLVTTREIHPLDPQPHRYCMLASTASAPRVTRCSLGLYWSRDLCSKHALAGWEMSSYLGQIVRGSEI